MSRPVHRAQAQLFLLSILSNPAILVILGIVLFAGSFGFLGFLNGITSIFGVDILSGTIAAIARPIAMVIGLFVIYEFAKSILQPKSVLQTKQVIMVIAMLVFLFNFGITGKLLPWSVTGVPETVQAAQNAPDAILIPTIIGTIIGGLTVYKLTGGKSRGV